MNIYIFESQYVYQLIFWSVWPDAPHNLGENSFKSFFYL